MDGGKWGVINSEGEVVYPAEYDYFTTDGVQFFTLSNDEGGYYDAHLYRHDSRSGETQEVFDNFDISEYDFVEIGPEAIRMSTRSADGTPDVLPALYVGYEEYDTFDFDFYTLTYLTANNVNQGGFDSAAIAALSAYTSDADVEGGAFVQYTTPFLEPATGAWYNVYAVSMYNEMLFTQDMGSETIEMLPYLPTEEGFFVCYLVDGESGERQLAFGNIDDTDFTARSMTSFPEEAAEMRPFYASGRDGEGTAYAGCGNLVILCNEDGEEAVYDMEKEAYVVSYADAQFFLPSSDVLPVRVAQEGKEGYVRPKAEEADDVPPMSIVLYERASDYCETEQIALVCAAAGQAGAGQIFLVDQTGMRVSEALTSSYDGALERVGYGDGCAFTLGDKGRVYLAIARSSR